MGTARLSLLKTHNEDTAKVYTGPAVAEVNKDRVFRHAPGGGDKYATNATLK